MVQPLRSQLTQGITPDRLAATLAIGTACSLFPFLGFTSLLNFLVGISLRLNQPILQILNQLLGALQLVMILFYIRIGEHLWQARPMPFNPTDMIRNFRENSFGEFLHQFGRAGMHALTAWSVTAPLLVAAIYFLVRPLMRRLASNLLRQA